jgi:hypothetical protein
MKVHHEKENNITKKNTHAYACFAHAYACAEGEKE